LRGQSDEAIFLIFETFVSQTSVKNTACILAGYVVPVLQNGALKLKKKLTLVGSRAVTSDDTLKLKHCEEKYPSEIRIALHEVCEDSIVDRSTV
jgi:hypothetical protein